MKPLSVAILVFISALYLSLMSLDATYFWDDEAHVGIIARNVLSTGSFTAWDGRNLYAYRNGTNLDQNLRIINPPLEYLVTAGAFLAFGPSTWSGRLPFVVAGLLSLVVFALILRHEFSLDDWLWCYAFAGLALAPAFLLYIRQCRYYALSLLFSLLAFYVYQLCIRMKHPAYFVLLAIVATLGFYSNHLLSIAFLLALCVLHFSSHWRDLDRKAWSNIALTISLFAIATIPYAVYYRIWDRPDIPAIEIWYLRRLKLLWWNFRDLNLIGYMPWVMAIGLAAFLFYHRRQQTALARVTRQWTTLGVAYVIFLALLSPQPTEVAGLADVRYLIPIQPFLVGLSGVLLYSVHRRMPLLALMLLVVTLSTNILTLLPGNREFRWLLPAYIQEIHQDYPTSYQAVATFLTEQAEPDDLVFTFPQHTNYPILFYAGGHLRFCCLLNHRTPLPRARLDALNAPLFLEQHAPDWFVSFGYHPVAFRILDFFSDPRHHSNRLNGDRFQYTLVTILNAYWKDTQRPELPHHSFGPKTHYDPYTEAVYVFRRTREKTAHDNPLPAEGL